MWQHYLFYFFAELDNLSIDELLHVFLAKAKVPEVPQCKPPLLRPLGSTAEQNS
jgi:hypothetical protein